MSSDLRDAGKEDEEVDWVFDYTMSVLKSPAWDAAVMGFVDEHCVVFNKEEENSLSFTEVHQQFTTLVERLLSSQLQDIGVSPETFVQACATAELSHRDINKQVVEQLIAMDDFETFKKLMVKRNMELEFEAVQALKDKGTPVIAPESQEEEDELLSRAFKESTDFSELDWQRQSPRGLQLQKIYKVADKALGVDEPGEDAQLEATLALSLAMQDHWEAKHSDSDKAWREDVRDDDMMRAAPRHAGPAVDKEEDLREACKPSSRDALPPLQHSRGPLGTEAVFERNPQAQKERKLLADSGVSAEEMEARAQHLRSQRDRIVAQKRSERESRLEKYNQDRVGASGASTPVDGAECGGGGGRVVDTDAAEAAQRNELRRALAQRIRCEVIEQERLSKTGQDHLCVVDPRLSRREDKGTFSHK